MLLSRDDILGVRDLVIEEIEVPEWGGSVCLRQFGGDERELVELRMMEFATPPEIASDSTKPRIVMDTKEKVTAFRGLRAFALSMALCTPEGASLFTPDDLAELGHKNAEVLERLFEHVMNRSGLGVDAVEEAKKNLEPTPTESSGFSLP